MPGHVYPVVFFDALRVKVVSGYAGSACCDLGRDAIRPCSFAGSRLPCSRLRWTYDKFDRMTDMDQTMETITMFFQGTLALATLMLVLVTFLLWRSSSAMARAKDQPAEIAESNRQLQHQPRLVISRVWRESESSTFNLPRT